MLRVVEDLVERRLLDDLAGIHHHHPVGHLGDDAEVVGDQHHRQVAVPVAGSPAAVEDLRLDGDVERGGRLVGDQQLRIAARAPSRSSPAAACRRRTGADSRRTRRSGLGMPTSRSSSTARDRASALRHVAVRADHLGDLVADPCTPGSARSSDPGTPSRCVRHAPSGTGRRAVRPDRHPGTSPIRWIVELGARVSPISVCAVTLLPLPDSPTTATTSPGETSKDTPSTAWTTPSSVRKLTCRSRTVRIGLIPAPPLPAGSADRAPHTGCRRSC